MSSKCPHIKEFDFTEQDRKDRVEKELSMISDRLHQIGNMLERLEKIMAALEQKGGTLQ